MPCPNPARATAQTFHKLGIRVQGRRTTYLRPKPTGPAREFKAPRYALGYRRRSRHPGLTSRGLTKSRAQQRKFWADPRLRRYADRVSQRGRYRRLPERVGRPTAGTAR